MQIEYTGEDLVRAIEINGYEQTYHKYITTIAGEIHGCALGQGSLNIGRGWKTFSKYLDAVGIPSHEVIYLNDARGLYLADIAKELRRKFPSSLKRKVVATSAPNAWKTKLGYQGIKVTGTHIKRHTESSKINQPRDSKGRFTIFTW